MLCPHDCDLKKKILIAIVLPNGELLYFLGDRRADQYIGGGAHILSFSFFLLKHILSFLDGYSASFKCT